MTLENDGRDPTQRIVRGSLDRWIRDPLSAFSFWSAIALPVLYLPLFVSGIETPAGLLVVFGLVGLHCLALVGGRDYRGDAT